MNLLGMNVTIVKLGPLQYKRYNKHPFQVSPVDRQKKDT